eukprot:CAMPEP_0115691134 /NCGR_PEP_ID=MMETSP0272-20121206/62490_1 /TAXON_ID=71861 /ORGANISM="Scrippsiella trochoidea, Strain CCMP3099" /LENGTH=91 /DNA_ID=CAMNT_0003131085 /DNA_START=204 /DNA_END=479 /DNA_ORIENTATION=+
MANHPACRCCRPCQQGAGSSAMSQRQGTIGVTSSKSPCTPSSQRASLQMHACDNRCSGAIASHATQAVAATISENRETLHWLRSPLNSGAT